MPTREQRGFDTLSQFLTHLEHVGELHRITAEVDPILEVPQIAIRALAEGRKALLFERINGSRFPLAMNVLASDRRLSIALGEDPGRSGRATRAFRGTINAAQTASRVAFRAPTLAADPCRTRAPY